MTHQRDVAVMSASAAAAGSNDTDVNSIAQKLVCGGEISSILKMLIGGLIENNPD